ncbi:SAM-dependent methyltransferase [Streptomyces drozdowiczii]|uniref:Class I SAM-dependent methyltransferase n=1 Tax=Streptomyces drozdowiczii TaxID=202862 RepID=A0ABY6Q2Q3_9ACTN|nr:class I SAM-dependent methyltransferase [Streptomyces drozdowiczii]MCX0245004.1 class I SAM-dependent methyltransferase [Streptomyces drozdowiczii]UZK58510.1 class I SAM-dependent methyltransferase [Streptomyces drozdowiczii]
MQARPIAGEPSPPPARLEWGTYPGIGPGAELLGRALRGRRILELGCGDGRNAAHLAGRHHAQVTAIDLIDLQTQHALEQYGLLPGLTFLTCDAMRYLRQTSTVFDIVYSIFGAVGLVDPRLLLTAIALRLRPHGILAFSIPHPQRAGTAAASGAQPRHSPLHLPDGSRRLVARWELDAAGWRRALAQADMRITAATELGHPGRDRPTALVITARRN